MDKRSLNPCFNGRYSQRNSLKKITQKFAGLNPCFNGRYSQSYHSLSDPDGLKES